MRRPLLYIPVFLAVLYVGAYLARRQTSELRMFHNRVHVEFVFVRTQFERIFFRPLLDTEHVLRYGFSHPHVKSHTGTASAPAHAQTHSSPVTIESWSPPYYTFSSIDSSPHRRGGGKIPLDVPFHRDRADFIPLFQ